MGKLHDPLGPLLRPVRLPEPTPTQRALAVHLRVLRRKIDESGCSYEDVRKRTGGHGAHLPELLISLRPLMLDELFVVLRAIGVTPGEYFEEVCRELDEVKGD